VRPSTQAWSYSSVTENRELARQHAPPQRKHVSFQRLAVVHGSLPVLGPPVLSRASDAGPSRWCGLHRGRRPKAAKERSRGKLAPAKQRALSGFNAGAALDGKRDASMRRRAMSVQQRTAGELIDGVLLREAATRQNASTTSAFWHERCTRGDLMFLARVISNSCAAISGTPAPKFYYRKDLWAATRNLERAATGATDSFMARSQA
jgi:hypothetical protein